MGGTTLISVDYPMRVIYAHTDMMGRVYYGRFFEYFEAARSHMLRELGLPYSEIEKKGTFLPVLESHCEYKSAATFEDALIVRTMIRELPKARLHVEYQVYRVGSRDLVAEGYTVHTFVNGSGRPIRPPKIFLETLKAHWSNGE